MKVSSKAIVAFAAVAFQSSLVSGKSGGGGGSCPYENCPGGDELPPCAFCQSSQDCFTPGEDGEDAWCPEGDTNCGCINFHINYCGYIWDESEGTGCNQYLDFVDGGINAGATSFAFSLDDPVDPFMIQGISSESERKLCWEVRDGKIKKHNKIVLGSCRGRDKQLFTVSTFQNDDGDWVNTVSPLDHPEYIVVGVRESEEKAWLRLEEVSVELDETQVFFARDDGMVGLGNDVNCEGDDCLFVTNQGLKANKHDPVMLTTHSRMMTFAKHGDVIQTWSIV